MWYSKWALWRRPLHLPTKRGASAQWHPPHLFCLACNIFSVWSMCSVFSASDNEGAHVAKPEGIALTGNKMLGLPSANFKRHASIFQWRESKTLSEVRVLGICNLHQTTAAKTPKVSRHLVCLGCPVPTLSEMFAFSSEEKRTKHSHVGFVTSAIKTPNTSRHLAQCQL